MKLYKLVINDFWVCKVNSGNHFTSLPGSQCQYRLFFPEYEKLTNTISQDIQRFFKEIAGHLFHTICRKHCRGVYQGRSIYQRKYCTSVLEMFLDKRMNYMIASSVKINMSLQFCFSISCFATKSVRKSNNTLCSSTSSRGKCSSIFL